MVSKLDFNKVKKQYFEVTLTDENKTTLHLLTPTKRQMSELGDALTMVGDDLTFENVNSLYDIVAQIMSRNKELQKITGEQLADLLDYEDLSFFVNKYAEFIAAVVNEKN